MTVLAQPDQRLDAGIVDYALLAVYFVLVLGIGLLARRSVSNSLDFLLSGRALPAWVTGLAFISANLGALEILGMTANGAEYGIPTVHYYWIGAIPAMVFLGLVMMPFYYGSKVRSVPEFLLRRFDKIRRRGGGVRRRHRGQRGGLAGDPAQARRRAGGSGVVIDLEAAAPARDERAGRRVVPLARAARRRRAPGCSRWPPRSSAGCGCAHCGSRSAVTTGTTARTGNAAMMRLALPVGWSVTRR